MPTLQEMDVEDYYNLPTYSTVDDKQIFENPKIGKLYRDPSIEVTTSQSITVLKIIGMVKSAVPYFQYAYPPVIEKIHVEESIIYVTTT